MYIKSKLIMYSALSILFTGCALPNLDALWPTGETDDTIVITEFPDESTSSSDDEQYEIMQEELDIANSEIESLKNDEVSELTDDSSSIESLITKNNLESDQESNLGKVKIEDEEINSIFTYVGKRILEMRDEFNKLDSGLKDKKIGFDNLQTSGISSAETYHATVAAIGARLQIGTTPGNPILLAQYEKAQIELAEVGKQGQSLVDLGNQIALLSARNSYLLEATRSAKRLRGAIDEDHRQLSRLEDDVKRSSIALTRLLEELNEAIRRRDIYLAAERRRLTQLATAISVGESFGPGLGNVKSLPPGNVERKADANLSGEPIAIIRIEGESEEYQQGLYGAVSAALDTQPSATFTLVAVSSTAGNASEKAERAAYAREKAGKVLKSLVSMGMPSSRLSVTEVASVEVENQEVRLYAD